MSPHAGGLDILINGKFFGVLIALAILGWMLKVKLTEDETRTFLWESWKFTKQIFPLLLIGAFAVGMIRVIIQPEWIETLAGQNSLSGNLAGVMFGVFIYFPTLAWWKCPSRRCSLSWACIVDRCWQTLNSACKAS